MSVWTHFFSTAISFSKLLSLVSGDFLMHFRAKSFPVLLCFTKKTSENAPLQREVWMGGDWQIGTSRKEQPGSGLTPSGCWLESWRYISSSSRVRKYNARFCTRKKKKNTIFSVEKRLCLHSLSWSYIEGVDKEFPCNEIKWCPSGLPAVLGTILIRVQLGVARGGHLQHVLSLQSC